MEIKNLLSDNIKRKFRKMFFGSEHFGIHFSQCGEDQIILAILDSTFKVKNGFYIDVGSFHPTIGSSTFLLYKKGWNGINIDPRPGSKKLFDKMRPGDINLELGIGATAGSLKYYFIGETSAMNSFSKDTLIENGVLDKVTKVIDCNVSTIIQVIHDYLPANKEIDFLNIDAEGFEEEVLATLDWQSYRPKVIAIELNKVTSLEDVLSTKINALLYANNYSAVSKNFVTKSVATIIYVDKKYLER